MGQSLRIVAFISIQFLFVLRSSASEYEISINKELPTAGFIRLKLDAPLESDTIFFTRQMNGSNIRSVICESSGQALLQRENGWLVPAGCNKIRWPISFIDAREPKYDVSKQESLYLQGKWWLFSEWGNLLRSSHEREELSICLENKTLCQHVPLEKEPPLLMLIGTPEHHIRLGSTSINIFSGYLPHNFNVLYLYKRYGKQLSYLYKVVNKANKLPEPRLINVLVLGIDASIGEVGGAAGVNSYLANIARTEQGTNSAEKIKHLWIGAHEIAHILGVGTNALWASESLAHYYGFKSFGKNKLAEKLFSDMTGEMDQIGLLKVNELVMQGEAQHYPQFYIKGAMFWRDLDNSIAAATQSKSSLDDYLSLLINCRFSEDGGLPVEFLGAMNEVIGREKMDQLQKKYL